MVGGTSSSGITEPTLRWRCGRFGRRPSGGAAGHHGGHGDDQEDSDPRHESATSGLAGRTECTAVHSQKLLPRRRRSLPSLKSEGGIAFAQLTTCLDLWKRSSQRIPKMRTEDRASLPAPYVNEVEGRGSLRNRTVGGRPGRRKATMALGSDRPAAVICFRLLPDRQNHRCDSREHQASRRCSYFGLHGMCFAAGFSTLQPLQYTS